MKLYWKLPLIGLAIAAVVVLDAISPRLWTLSLDDKLTIVIVGIGVGIGWPMLNRFSMVDDKLDIIEGKLDAILKSK